MHYFCTCLTILGLSFVETKLSIIIELCKFFANFFQTFFRTSIDSFHLSKLRITFESCKHFLKFFSLITFRINFHLLNTKISNLFQSTK